MELKAWAARLRCIGLWLLMLQLIAMLPALLLGSVAAAPGLRALLPQLRAVWGDTVATAVAVRTAQLLGLLGLSGDGPALQGGMLQRLVLHLMPQSAALLQVARSWPQGFAAHLCAFSLWLGLLYPLAWLQARACRRPGRKPGVGAGHRIADGASPAVLLPACAALTALLWLATPSATVVWAPLCAAAWLLSCLEPEPGVER